MNDTATVATRPDGQEFQTQADEGGAIGAFSSESNFEAAKRMGMARRRLTLLAARSASSRAMAMKGSPALFASSSRALPRRSWSLRA